VPIRLKENKLLIVEGKSDRAMITALLSKHDIAGIDVFSPFDHNGTLGHLTKYSASDKCGTTVSRAHCT